MVDPDQVLDLNGGTLYTGDERVFARDPFRAVLANAKPTSKGGKIVLETGGNLITKNKLKPIPTARTLEPETMQGQPTGGSSNVFVDLNGLTSTLTSALSFTVGVYPYNGGIDLNTQPLVLNGPLSIAPDSDLVLYNASDMSFSNNIELGTTWTFDGDGVLAGNGGVLDLSGGGVLVVRPNTSLGLHNFVLRGLQDGSIIFYDKTSELRLSNMVVELSDSTTFTTGGIYVQGPTTIITGNSALSLESAASMSVDRVSLLYDTLSYPDEQNISPAIGADANNKHVISINNGVIRHLNAPTQGNVRISADRGLAEALLIHPDRMLLFNNSATLDGNTLPIIFSNAQEPLITVAAGRDAVIQNARLEYFSPSYVSLGAGASLQFGDQTAMTFAANQDLNMTLTFAGSCRINGNNHRLNLGDAGGIMVSGEGSALLLENMVITGLSGTKINCTDETCTFSLHNVQFVVDGSYDFPTERVEVLQSGV